MFNREVFYLGSTLSTLKFEKDPYVEMYYYDKIQEKESGSNVRTMREAQFMTVSQKQEIAKNQMKSKIKSSLFSIQSNSLGVCEKRRGRSQAHLLSIDDLGVDDEDSAKLTHLRVLSAIEVRMRRLPNH